MTLARLSALYPALEEFSALAREHGIDDVFSDNNGRTLQLCLALDLKILPGRTGNDLRDADDVECELKTTTLKSRSFSTHHHLTASRINKYSAIPWLFALYDGFKLHTVYRTEPGDLDDIFIDWLYKLDHVSAPLNNPKIPLSHVQKVGRVLYAS